MKQNELLTWLWLAAAFPWGSVKPAELLGECGDAAGVFARREECAKADFLSPAEREGLLSHCPDEFTPVLESCNQLGIGVVGYGDPAYPARLRTIDGPPMALYYQGDLSVLSAKLCIAAVGTRTPSDYSRRVADYLGRELAQQGACVLSGCSEGVDADVHRGALQTGVTAAVLSCSLERDYPSSNAGLKREILQRGGALLSEFPPATAFFSMQFSLRNRLLSGLSDGVAVVEASAASGSLSAAQAAADQGRELFCIPPADLFNPRYDGVKPLLREGAVPLLSAGDIFEAFRYQYTPPPAVQENPFSGLSSLSEPARELYRALPDEPVDPGYLSAKTGLSAPLLMRLLTELELSGALRRSAGRFQKAY